MDVVSDEDDQNGELQRRISRLEVLTALAFVSSDHDIDDESRYILSRYLRAPTRGRGKYPASELSYLVERILHRPQRPARDHLERQMRDFRQEYDRQLGQLQDKLDAAFERIDTTGRQINFVQREQKELSAHTHEWLAVQSLGLDSSHARLSRFIPLRVYLSDTPGAAVDEVSRAVDELLEAFGFGLADDFPAVRGSWFKRWFAKSRDVMTQPEVKERLDKLERAVELKGLAQPQAEIDAKQAAAVAQLMKATKDVPYAALQVGSILFIKQPSEHGPLVQVRTLSQVELIHLENNQKLLSSPGDLLERLSELCQSTSEAPPRIERGGNGKARSKGRKLDLGALEHRTGNQALGLLCETDL